MNGIVGEVDFGWCEMLYLEEEELRLGVDSCMNVEMVEKGKGLRRVGKKKKELKEVENEGYEGGSERR